MYLLGKTPPAPSVRTYEDDSSGGEDGNYTYLSTQRFDSDAESEEQEEIWLNSVTSGVFEAEAYPVQRVPKVSRSTRAGGSKTGNVPVVTNPAFDRTRKVKFEEMRPRKGSVDMDVKSDMSNARNGTDRRIPVDVHENVFDGNVDHDLVPMEVEDTGGKDDGGKKDKPVGGKSNRDTREVTKVRPDAVKTSIQLSGQIMKSTHTVALETLLEISPQLRRALGSAVRGTNGNPSPESRKENESKTFAAVPDDGDEAPWGQAPITRQMVADNERDNLLKIKVHVGDVAIMAIIDTGSQANLISERAYSASGLMRTDENIMPMVGAFGGHGVCIGKLEWVPLYITAGKVLTWGSKIGVLRNPPFDMILGQTWLTGNKVSIEQRPEGVYLSLIYKNKKVLVNVCPNSRYLRRAPGGKENREEETYTILNQIRGEHEQNTFSANPDDMEPRIVDNVQEIFKSFAVKGFDRQIEGGTDTRMELKDEVRSDGYGHQSQKRRSLRNKEEVEDSSSSELDGCLDERPGICKKRNGRRARREARGREEDVRKEREEEGLYRKITDERLRQIDQERENAGAEERGLVGENERNDLKRSRKRRSLSTHGTRQATETRRYQQDKAKEVLEELRKDERSSAEDKGRKGDRRDQVSEEEIRPQRDCEIKKEKKILINRSEKRRERNSNEITLMGNANYSKAGRGDNFQEGRKRGRELSVKTEPEFANEGSDARVELGREGSVQDVNKRRPERKNEHNKDGVVGGAGKKPNRYPIRRGGAGTKGKTREFLVASGVIAHAAGVRIGEGQEELSKRRGERKSYDTGREGKTSDEEPDGIKPRNKNSAQDKWQTYQNQRYRQERSNEGSLKGGEKDEMEQTTNSYYLNRVEERNRDQWEETEDEEEKPRRQIPRKKPRSESGAEQQRSKKDERNSKEIADSEDEDHEEDVINKENDNLGRSGRRSDKRVEEASENEKHKTKQSYGERKPQYLVDRCHEEYHSQWDQSESEALSWEMNVKGPEDAPDEKVDDEEYDEEVTGKNLGETVRREDGKKSEPRRLTSYQEKELPADEETEEVRSPRATTAGDDGYNNSPRNPRNVTRTPTDSRTFEEIIRLTLGARAPGNR